MDEKVTLIMKRLSELHDFLRDGKGDPKLIRGMIKINEDILFLLQENMPVIFYKVPEEIPAVIPSLKSVFFCPEKK